MNDIDPKIIFFGTPGFAKTILERLIASDYKPSLVVTQPDMPTGRKQTLTPPPVKLLAEENSIPVFQPKKLDPDAVRTIQDTKSDLFIVVAYGKIIPKSMLDVPKYGALNIHPSLLPQWRGPSPIQYAILKGAEKTGITIMLIDGEIDHGDIVSNKKLEIKNEKFTAEELSHKLAGIGANLLIETIPKWIAGEIEPKEQDHKNATYSKILTKKDGRIDWNKSAKEIERQIRAFTPWPGSYTFWDDKRLNIMRGSLITDSDISFKNKNLPGQVAPYGHNKFAIMTKDGAFVVSRVQLAGRDEISSKQFLNGYSNIIGSTLE